VGALVHRGKPRKREGSGIGNEYLRIRIGVHACSVACAHRDGDV